MSKRHTIWSFILLLIILLFPAQKAYGLFNVTVNEAVRRSFNAVRNEKLLYDPQNLSFRPAVIKLLKQIQALGYQPCLVIWENYKGKDFFKKMVKALDDSTGDKRRLIFLYVSLQENTGGYWNDDLDKRVNGIDDILLAAINQMGRYTIGKPVNGALFEWGLQKLLKGLQKKGPLKLSTLEGQAESAPIENESIGYADIEPENEESGDSLTFSDKSAAGAAAFLIALVLYVNYFRRFRKRWQMARFARAQGLILLHFSGQAVLCFGIVIVGSAAAGSALAAAVFLWIPVISLLFISGRPGSARTHY